MTAATYERLKEQFTFEDRGYRSIKGKSEMMTYWLAGMTYWLAGQKST